MTVQVNAIDTEPDWSAVWDGSPSGAIYGAGLAPDGVAIMARRDRYTLHRCWSPSRPPEIWLMCNPSTATAETDDATIRRVKSYSHDWGAGGFIVVNAYALRSTNPKRLHDYPDPIGHWNDAAIAHVCELAARRPLTRECPRPRIMGSWGAVAEDGPAWSARERALLAIVADAGVEICALATTDSGAPVHPLRQPKTATPIRWYRAAA